MRPLLFFQCARITSNHLQALKTRAIYKKPAESPALLRWQFRWQLSQSATHAAHMARKPCSDYLK